MFRLNLHLFYCITLCLGLYSHATSAQPAIESELLGRLTRAENELQEVQRKISAESRDYAQRLEQKERSVRELRKEAAVRQRAADEQLLSLEKLKERTDQWAAQKSYQTQLLSHYRDAAGMSKQTGATGHLLTHIHERAEAALNPGWREARVISANGQMVQAPILKLGPVEIALDSATRSSGLLVRESGLEAHIVDVFDQSIQSEIWALQADGRGYYPFDPTLGNALQVRSQDGETLIEFLRRGGIWVIPIVAFGILSLLISLLKAGQFLRLPRVDGDLADCLMTAARQGQSKGNIDAIASTAGATQRKLVHIAASNPVSQQRDDLLVACLMENRHRLEKYMGVVATSASVAPLLGLLGTVSGMIDTFKMMTIFGAGDPSAVSGGISEALITTELGLVVAIPSLIVSALLARQIKSHAHQLENFAIKLSKITF